MAQHTIEVIGYGSVSYSPDVLYISFVVEAIKQEATQAQEEVKDKCKKLVVGLIELGLTKENINTASYSLGAKYEWDKDRNKTFIGFEAQNWMIVKTEEIELAGKILDIITSSGITEINDISFGLRDWEVYANQALTDAAKNARQKAEAIAKGLGLSIGSVLDVSSSDMERYRPRRRYTQNYSSREMFLEERADTDSFISTPSDIKGGTSVRVIFAISDSENNSFVFTNKDYLLWLKWIKPRNGKKFEDMYLLSDIESISATIKDIETGEVIIPKVLLVPVEGHLALKPIDGTDDWKSALGTHGDDKDYILLIKQVSYR